MYYINHPVFLQFFFIVDGWLQLENLLNQIYLCLESSKFRTICSRSRCSLQCLQSLLNLLIILGHICTSLRGYFLSRCHGSTNNDYSYLEKKDDVSIIPIRSFMHATCFIFSWKTGNQPHGRGLLDPPPSFRN